MAFYSPALDFVFKRWFTRRGKGQDRAAAVRRGQELLDHGDTAGALHEFRALDVIDGAEGATEAFETQRLDFERVRRGEPHYRWLDDVRVDTAYWTVMRDGCLFNDDVHAKNLATSPFVRGRVSRDGKRVIATLPSTSATVDGPCVLVGGDDNYSHWLFRNMLKLSTLDRAGLLYSHPWLVNADLKSYQTEYISMLGQTTDRLIKVERNAVIACRRVLVPALHISGRAILDGVRWIRKRFAHLLVHERKANRRLFISRRDSARRSVRNEDEIFDALLAQGFERIVPGQMSVTEQIEAFSGARCIVAAHGAALTNMIFAPAGAAILELTSSAIEHMNLFRKLARTTGQKITTILSDDYAAGAGGIDVNSDYRVDAHAVAAAAKKLVAG